MQVQSLPLQQKVARSGHCSASLPSHDGEESAIICSTFGREEFAYQGEDSKQPMQVYGAALHANAKYIAKRLNMVAIE